LFPISSDERDSGSDVRLLHTSKGEASGLDLEGFLGVRDYLSLHRPAGKNPG